MVKAAVVNEVYDGAMQNSRYRGVQQIQIWCRIVDAWERTVESRQMRTLTMSSEVLR